MSNLNPASLQVVPVFSQAMSNVGPKAVPLFLNFTDNVTTVIQLDLSSFIDQGFMDFVQCAYIDASLVAAGIIMTIAGSGQNVTIKPNTQGYYPVLAPNPFRVTFTASQPGIGVVPVYLTNMPIAGVVWATS